MNVPFTHGLVAIVKTRSARFDLNFLDRTRRRSVFDSFLPLLPSKVTSRLFILSLESDSSSESHAMEGKEEMSLSKVKLKSSEDSDFSKFLCLSLLASSMSCCACFNASVAGHELTESLACSTVIVRNDNVVFSEMMIVTVRRRRYARDGLLKNVTEHDSSTPIADLCRN